MFTVLLITFTDSYKIMKVSFSLRLCCTAKSLFSNTTRFYTNRNILKLHERGMFEDLFPDTSANEITNLLNKSPQCVYAGFDPTADSLHIGNLLILMNLLYWQRAGHQVIALLGGATALLGDPSHRKSERAEIKKDVANENLVCIKENIQRLFDNHEKYFWSEDKFKLKPLKIINNIEWYTDKNVIEFISSVGRYFRIGTMLGRSSVQSRLNSSTGMSFPEFTYQLFQAYDWLYLYKTFDCHFQIGGADQMGNIVSGYDLITKVTKNNVYGLTLPLITAEGGKKFGKSLGNAVWLSPKKTSSFQLYQFFMRAKDSDVEKFLKFFTFFPLGRINEIIEQHKKVPEKREAQKLLADQITLLVHGQEGLHSAQRISEVIYSNDIEAISKMPVNDIIQMFDGASVVELTAEIGMTVYELAQKAKCFKWEKDIQRIIEAGGFHINYQKITNMNEVIVSGIHILPNNITIIRVGKKTYHIVRWL